MKKTPRNLKQFSISRAHQAQILLSRKVIRQTRLPEKDIKLIAGVDVSYKGDTAIGIVAILDYASMALLETQTAICAVKFPYIPTLLSFREIPPVIAAIRNLKLRPDIFLVDAHGLAHPYRFGFASHLGVALEKPTIGVAKSMLIGAPTKIGNEVFLVHDNEIVGAVITTRKDVKPIYVSIGHQVSLESAVAIVKHCVRDRRVPEPLFIAHKLASDATRLLANGLQKI
jgi:deoxyribonuclease V